VTPKVSRYKCFGYVNIVVGIGGHWTIGGVFPLFDLVFTLSGPRIHQTYIEGGRSTVYIGQGIWGVWLRSILHPMIGISHLDLVVIYDVFLAPKGFSSMLLSPSLST
jgi:hypothetical protein